MFGRTHELLLIVLLPPAALAGPARGDVFVDARRGDDGRGTGAADRPFRTLAAAAAHMRPGDRCTLRAGVYRETIAPGDGQTFRAAPGEEAVVSGCDPIGGWTREAGGTFVAKVGREVRQVYWNGEPLVKARFPDQRADPTDPADWAATVARRGRPAGDGTAEVTFPDGLHGKTYVGGFFTGFNGRNPFQANMGRIVAADGDTLRCDRTNLRWYRSRPGEFDGPGRGYVTHHLDALTAPREWHWERGALHLIPPADAQLGDDAVEARTRLYGFDLSGRTGVTIAGLTFRAASVLMDGSTGCTLTDCDFEDVSPWGNHFDRRANGDPERYSYGNPEDGTAGVYVDGTGNAIRDCRLSGGWGALVTLRGEGNVLERSVLEDANRQEREFAVNVVVNGANQRVVDNRLRGSTAMLVALIDIDRLPTTAPTISRNDCRDYGRRLLDGGTAAIYYNGNDDLGGGEFSYNLIADNRTADHRVSCGIYLDDGAFNARVHHNVIVGDGRTRCGLLTHLGTRQVSVFNNTFWGQREAAWLSLLRPGEGDRDAATLIYRSNLSGGAAYAQSGGAGTITRGRNREHVPATAFVDVAALDFRLKDAAASDLGAHDGDAPWRPGPAPGSSDNPGAVRPPAPPRAP